MGPLWKIRLAPDVSSPEANLAQRALEKGTVEENRIFHSHSRVKKFFKVEAGSSSLFIKLREYPTWPRRLARWFTKTKEEREFRNYLLLRRAQVPCPRPICSGRKGAGLSRSQCPCDRLSREHKASARSLAQRVQGGASLCPDRPPGGTRKGNSAGSPMEQSPSGGKGGRGCSLSGRSSPSRDLARKGRSLLGEEHRVVPRLHEQGGSRK